MSPLGGIEQSASFKTISEYAAGFVPLGSYLASREISATAVTTGAATKLVGSGISDAKIHNIPAVFIIALNSTTSAEKSPLQDVTPYGANIIRQIQAELGDGCIVLDAIEELASKLETAKAILADSRPVALLFHPDVLCKTVPEKTKPASTQKNIYTPNDNFVQSFLKVADNRRIVIFVGEEAAREPAMKHLSKQAAVRLQAPMVWSVNGANGVSEDNPYGYGHISFGGNCQALRIWESLGEDDVLLLLGFEPTEYVINLKTINAGSVWHLSNIKHAYGSKNGNHAHYFSGKYHRIYGRISGRLSDLIQGFDALPIRRPKTTILTNLNSKPDTKENMQTLAGTVNIIDFYRELEKYWRPHSIGFDDICVSYRDRQFITQRPIDHIPFYALYGGSAMGSAFGLGIGAKMSDPSLNTFIFSGDGCWRLYGGGLADVASMGIRLFMMDNNIYGIVQQGLRHVMPNIPEERYHTNIGKIDFIAAAKAHGWDAITLADDLSNMNEIMTLCYKPGPSLLIRAPLDPNQSVGSNPRIKNITYL